ncbi:MAG: hypothetical protein R2942_04750 [Ignavibacteria bacterium]
MLNGNINAPGTINGGPNSDVSVGGNSFAAALESAFLISLAE